MIEKHKLNLIVAIVVLAFSIWLIWVVRTWNSVGQLLQGVAVAFVIMAFVRDEEKTAKLDRLLVRSFVISYVLTSIIWLVSLGFVASSYSAYFSLWLLISPLVYVVLPRSLLPVAICIIVYGFVRTKLKPWEILLSTWYVSVFAVFAGYEIWWTLFVQPYIHDFYASGAGAIALDMLLVALAFVTACVLSIIYLVFRKSEERP